MRKSRLGLKRTAGGKGGAEEGKRRAATQQAATEQQAATQQAHAAGKPSVPLGVDPMGNSWATDFAAEVEGAGQPPHQRQQGPMALEQLGDTLIISDTEEEEGGGLQSMHIEDEQARQGLLKIADSMRRRVDEGQVQLLRMQRLQQQKQELVARGEAVLAQHCATSWHRRQQQQPGVLPSMQEEQQEMQNSGVEVQSLRAVCAAGQWWLMATVRLPGQQQASSGWASLLVASTGASLMCRQQQCSRVSNSSTTPAAHVQLQLAATLDIQQQQQQQQLGEGLWADVFLLIERAAEPATAGEGGVVALRGSAMAAPPVLLGRVQLSWAEWMRSHSGSQPPAGFLPPVPPQVQHSAVLAVAAEQLDLQCLSRIVQQHLGCVPAAVAAASSSGSTTAFVLQGAAPTIPGSAVAAAATVQLTQHSSQFAEVQLQACSIQMLAVLQQQLGEGLRQAAQQAGVPPGDVSVEHSLLSAQHVQKQAATADTLVQELDASIEWVELLLKEKLALESQLRQRKRTALGPELVRQRQTAALTAMAATDGCMVSLLTQH